MSTTNYNKTMTSIATSGLTKQYPNSSRKALDNLNLKVASGEVYGFLGPNGAGKSTTIRLLMNFIRPTAGQATILGQDSVRDSVAIKRSVGYLAGDMAIYPKLTGEQYLSYMAQLQPPKSPTYVKELNKRLKTNLQQRVGNLSRGNRQKLSIVQAFMHEPDVLILDEPSSGLDPLMQEVFYTIIHEAKQRQATVFMSSHILSEVQKVCDRVGIIRDGTLITERSIAEMATEAAQTFDIVFKDKVPLAKLNQVKGIKVVRHNGPSVTIHMHGPLAPLFKLLATCEVVKMDTRQLDLEEVFLRYYEGSSK